ncbi:MAG: carbon-nitrogen hydrolase family protein [Candidatus Hodarchaeota archaeon]
MGRVIKVAAVQATPVFMNKKETVEKYSTYIEEAGNQGAQLIVTPETGISTYPYWRGSFGYIDPEKSKDWRDTVIAFYENALKIPSPETETFCKVAKKANAYCVIGCNEQDDRLGSHTLYNTQLFIGRNGEILGRHRKTVPTHQERFFWGRGDARDLRVFETDIGRIGGLICYENHMTLLKAVMASKGEEIHACCWPGYWTFDDKNRVRDLSGRIGPLHTSDQDCAIREYAFETQTFVISAGLYLPVDQIPENFPFKEQTNSRWAVGGSCVAGPFGTYLAEPVFNEETIVYATIDMDERILAKNIFDCMGHYARWDLVSLNIRQEGFEPTGSSEKTEMFQLNADQLEEMAQKLDISSEKIQKIIEELVEKYRQQMK